MEKKLTGSNDCFKLIKDNQIFLPGQDDVETGETINEEDLLAMRFGQNTIIMRGSQVTILTRRLTIEDLARAQTEDEDEYEEEHAEEDSGADVRVFPLPPPVDLWEVNSRLSCWWRSQRFWTHWWRGYGFERGRRSHRYDPGHSVGRRSIGQSHQLRKMAGASVPLHGAAG